MVTKMVDNQDVGGGLCCSPMKSYETDCALTSQRISEEGLDDSKRAIFSPRSLQQKKAIYNFCHNRLLHTAMQLQIFEFFQGHCKMKTTLSISLTVHNYKLNKKEKLAQCINLNLKHKRDKWHYSSMVSYRVHPFCTCA